MSSTHREETNTMKIAAKAGNSYYKDFNDESDFDFDTPVAAPVKREPRLPRAKSNEQIKASHDMFKVIFEGWVAQTLA